MILRQSHLTLASGITLKKDDTISVIRDVRVPNSSGRNDQHQFFYRITKQPSRLEFRQGIHYVVLSERLYNDPFQKNWYYDLQLDDVWSKIVQYYSIKFCSAIFEC